MLVTLNQKGRSHAAYRILHKTKPGLLGRNVYKRPKACIFVRSENVVGKASGVSYTEWQGWTELPKPNYSVHYVFTQGRTPGNTQVTHLGPSG